MNAYNKISLTRYTATVCRLMGIEPPACAGPPIDWACDLLSDLCKDGFDRVLIHNPDAVGMWLAQAYPDAFEPVLKHTHLTIPFRSPMPSVTPVCFGTMYTGAEPAVHGIQAYTKPIIRIETFFDAVLKAGKKVAIVATENCSMGKIFLERDIAFYYVSKEGEALEKAQQLIAEDAYDVICVYTFLYDTHDHKYGPEDPISLNSLYRQGQIFDALVASVKRNWKQHNTLVAFSPDHGVHEVVPYGSELNSKGNPIRGNHGSDRPQDLNILHYFGVVRRSDRK